MSTRREFVTLLGGAAAWPISARAQQAERLQAERLRHVAVLLPATADNPVFQSWVAAFFQGLALLGWTVGRNLRVETR
jgi:putative ABC transport system substrate-binding protein